MQIELASQNSPLVIAVQNNNGILVPIQGLDQFLYGDKDLRILCSLYGQSLFDILYDDHGLIRYEDNKFALSKIIELDTNRTVMSIAGKVGESVVVRRCKQYANLNLLWMRIASGKQVQRSTAIRYRAVGTGFKSTERDYPKVYNPQDTQRDIIWLDDEGFRYQIAGSTSTAGIDAGLQVKVSTDGMRYVYHDVLDSIYEIPLVYFDLNNDYGIVYRRVQQELNRRGENTRNLQDWFISGREIDPDAFDEIEYYTDMIRALVKGRLTVDSLINRAERFPSFGSAVMAGTMETVASQIIVEPSDDWDNKAPDI